MQPPAKQKSADWRRRYRETSVDNNGGLEGLESCSLIDPGLLNGGSRQRYTKWLFEWVGLCEPGREKEKWVWEPSKSFRILGKTAQT